MPERSAKKRTGYDIALSSLPAAHPGALRPKLAILYCLPCCRRKKKLCQAAYGERQVRYLKQNHRIQDKKLLTGGKLNRYLAAIDEQTEEIVYPNLIYSCRNAGRTSINLRLDKIHISE